MRDLIKIIIALFFMAGAFIVGKYISDEKCSVQLKEMDEKSAIYKNQIQQLQDSLTLLKMEVIEINSKKLAGTVESKPRIITTK